MNAINPSDNPTVAPPIREFLSALNASGDPPIETLSPTAARQVLINAQTFAAVDLPPAEVEKRSIQQDGLDVGIHLVRPVRPPDASRGGPAFLFLHGGGWVLGDYATHERLVRDLVAESGYPAIFVDYSPSPEARYPTAIQESLAVAKWVAAHGEEIGVDGSRLAIVGNSVGGNMSAAVSLLARHQGGPDFLAQVLLWPVTDATFETPSYHEYAKGYFLTRSMMQWFWDAYTTDAAQRREIYASPLRATREQLEGQPPALIQVAGNDVLRDEGIAYAQKLEEAGTEVTLVRYENLIHDYGLLNALSRVPAVQDALRQVASFLREHLK